MALNLESEYLDVIPGDTDYPEGSFKNETTPGALDGTPYEKAWANDIQGILQKLLTVAGITPSGNPDTVPASQYFESLLNIFNLFIGYDDNTLGGAPNDLKLSSKGADPESYLDGMILIFKAANTNTAATTLQIGTLGVAALKDKNGNDLLAGDIPEGSYLLISYNATDSRFELVYAVDNFIPLRRGFIGGLTISNNSTDPANDLDISVGECRDDLNQANIFLKTALTKQLDVTWTEGTNNGGRAAGVAYTANTTYHVFVITTNDGSKSDVGFDTSTTAANLMTDAAVIAAGYTIYRRIASIITDITPAIIGFTQDGDTFIYDDLIVDALVTNPGTSAALATLTTPLGIKTKPLFMFLGIDTAGSATLTYFLITAPYQNDSVPGANNFTSWVGATTTTETQEFVYPWMFFTNLSSQIRYRLSRSTASVSIRIHTWGYVDLRNQDV